ncbi:probable receptor-like protein kinase At1g11050 [Andrographis paniculata]|uniref:probable receptor-like protein kinase At1g11050 n=1 Tax=Andrographis paniculata TaxID=175694 RepID=UPI0021E84A3A|nr:probable receptor-like protein kinase At1g11050 [Andrographis paniculata]
MSAAALLSFFLVLPAIQFGSSVGSSCPINFTYVGTFPWDTSPCRQSPHPECCQTLRGVLGIGLAEYLNRTSRFYLPDADTSSSCLLDFRDSLGPLSISGDVFGECFNDTGEFANKPSSCAGIATLNDWNQKVPRNIPLESSCSSDSLTGMVSCVFYAAAIVNDFGPEDVRVASCMLRLPLAANKNADRSNSSKVRLISGILGGLLGACLAVFVFLFYRRWSRKMNQEMVHQHYVVSMKSKVQPNTGAKWFHISELEQATDGFSDRNVIGRGGFGIVYKGTLPGGAEVAVKQVLDLDSKGDDEFTNEAEIISKIRHRNLLSLRGFCVSSERFQGKRRFLVYDYMCNGSLDDHLFVDGGKNHLSWPQRKNIILDIAKGLAYLHYGINPAVYHRDIKATNILLDSDMRAKVADFGLVKVNAGGESHVTTRVAGTRGYLAPEYALYGHLTEKTDVYSFGILILEIISSRKALDASEPWKRLITDWAWECLKSGRVEEIFHDSIRQEGPKTVMERFAQVGILCAHVTMAARPTIAEAVRMLEGDIDVPELPPRPAPLRHEPLEMSFGYSMSTLSKGSMEQSSVGSSIS